MWNIKISQKKFVFSILGEACSSLSLWICNWKVKKTLTFMSYNLFMVIWMVLFFKKVSLACIFTNLCLKWLQIWPLFICHTDPEPWSFSRPIDGNQIPFLVPFHTNIPYLPFSSSIFSFNMFCFLFCMFFVCMWMLASKLLIL